ncbi:hypothetical protein GEMRC1_009285 [Eukaryota sp. GEM-RC1]
MSLPNKPTSSDKSVIEARRRCQARIRHVKQREQVQKKVQEKQGLEQYHEKKRRRRLEELKALVLLRESEDRTLVKKRGEQISKERRIVAQKRRTTEPGEDS